MALLTQELKQKWQDSSICARALEKLKCYGPSYLLSLLPITSWLRHYNLTYLIGDVIAGVTVGIMLVPQSLAYAKLANLPVQFGLYTGFAGTLFYCLTGTSREISVGPTAVLSLLVGKVINDLSDGGKGKVDSVEVAVALGFLLGIVCLIVGILRLGAILDLIPMPVILGFTTGLALTIMLTQIPNLLGIPDISSNQSNPLMLANIVTSLPKIKHLDLILGLSSILFILLINTACKKFMGKYPRLRYLKASANGISVAVFTLMVYLIFLNNSKVDIKIIKEVPSGFTKIGIPNLNTRLLYSLLPELAPIVIITILEHIAAAKSFSRQSGYQINSSQEIFTLGIINTFGSFFSAFPSTGSFSRSAVMSQSGVQTPLASMFSAAIVLMALSFLTPAFYYIPSACLSAIIVVSASHLVVEFNVLKNLTKCNPTDGLVVVVAAITTFIAGAELGIAVAVGLSFIVLLYKLARPKLEYLTPDENGENIFIAKSLKHVQIYSSTPGVLIFRPSTWLIFPNMEYVKNLILDISLLLTKSPSPTAASKDKTKLWSEDLIAKGQKLRYQKSQLLGKQLPKAEDLPFLRGLILDLSNVNYIDASGLQGLVDLRDMLIKYVGCEHDGSIKRDPTFELNLFVKENDFESNNLQKKTTLEAKPKRFDIIFVTTNSIIIEQLSKAGLLNKTASITLIKGDASCSCSYQEDGEDIQVNNSICIDSVKQNPQEKNKNLPISYAQMTVKTALDYLISTSN